MVFSNLPRLVWLNETHFRLVFPHGAIGLGKFEHSHRTQVWTKTTIPKPFEDVVLI